MRDKLIFHTQGSLSKHDRLSHSSCQSCCDKHTHARVHTLLLTALKHIASPCSVAPDSWENRGRAGGRSPGGSVERRWSCQLKGCPHVSCTAGPYWGWSSGPGGSAAHRESGHCPAGWRKFWLNKFHKRSNMDDNRYLYTCSAKWAMKGFIPNKHYRYLITMISLLSGWGCANQWN